MRIQTKISVKLNLKETKIIREALQCFVTNGDYPSVGTESLDTAQQLLRQLRDFPDVVPF